MASEQHAIILLFLCCISTSLTAVSQNHRNLTRRISKIKDGCVKDQTYKMDCNTCHCVAGNVLCTKMACIKRPGLKKGKNLRSSAKTCTPGKFYKDGCMRCFCSNEERLFCAPKDCETVGRLPKTHEAIHAHSSYKPSEQYLLPTLPNHSARCNPGFTYRVHCNTCLCLANGNLVCGQLFCPSHDDVHEGDAKKMSAQRRQNTESPGLEETHGKCTPGKFYKRGCKQCFCDEKQRPVCWGDGDCKLVNKHPTNPRSIRTYTRPELLKLPALSHQGANCTPGVTFRVECNACVCLANKNLMCDDLLCPSFEDVNRIKANSLTGQPCTAVNMNQACINCTCDKGTLNCEAKPICIPTEGRRDFEEELPLDLDLKTEKRQCTKGMVYKRDCNKCYCQKDNSLRCTLMRCLKHTEVERLKVLRMQLEKNGL